MPYTAIPQDVFAGMIKRCEEDAGERKRGHEGEEESYSKRVRVVAAASRISRKRWDSVCREVAARGDQALDDYCVAVFEELDLEGVATEYARDNMEQAFIDYMMKDGEDSVTDKTREAACSAYLHVLEEWESDGEEEEESDESDSESSST
jgi:hypothetical protein